MLLFIVTLTLSLIICWFYFLWFFFCNRLFLNLVFSNNTFFFSCQSLDSWYKHEQNIKGNLSNKWKWWKIRGTSSSSHFVTRHQQQTVCRVIGWWAGLSGGCLHATSVSARQQRRCRYCTVQLIWSLLMLICSFSVKLIEKNKPNVSFFIWFNLTN